MGWWIIGFTTLMLKTNYIILYIYIYIKEGFHSSKLGIRPWIFVYQQHMTPTGDGLSNTFLVKHGDHANGKKARLQ